MRVSFSRRAGVASLGGDAIGANAPGVVAVADTARVRSPTAKARTSFSVTMPPSPLPTTRARSTPRSAASRLARGEATTRTFEVGDDGGTVLRAAAAALDDEVN